MTMQPTDYMDTEDQIRNALGLPRAHEFQIREPNGLALPAASQQVSASDRDDSEKPEPVRAEPEASPAELIPTGPPDPIIEEYIEEGEEMNIGLAVYHPSDQERFYIHGGIRDSDLSITQDQAEWLHRTLGDVLERKPWEKPGHDAQVSEPEASPAGDSSKNDDLDGDEVIYSRECGRFSVYVDRDGYIDINGDGPLPIEDGTDLAGLRDVLTEILETRPWESSAPVATESRKSGDAEEAEPEACAAGDSEEDLKPVEDEFHMIEPPTGPLDPPRLADFLKRLAQVNELAARLKSGSKAQRELNLDVFMGLEVAVSALRGKPWRASDYRSAEGARTLAKAAVEARLDEYDAQLAMELVAAGLAVEEDA